MNSSIIDQIDTEIARLKAVRKCVARTIEAGIFANARAESRRARRIRLSSARERIRMKRWAR